MSEYFEPTRFGKKRKRIKLDGKIPRPQTLDEKRELIWALYQENGWDERDIKIDLDEFGVAGKMTEEQADRILDKRADSKMVLFED